VAIIVHIAGKMIGGKQFCTRCGLLLIDNNGAMVPVGDDHGLSYWEEGGEVANEGSAWVAVKHIIERGEMTSCE